MLDTSPSLSKFRYVSKLTRLRLSDPRPPAATWDGAREPVLFLDRRHLLTVGVGGGFGVEWLTAGQRHPGAALLSPLLVVGIAARIGIVGSVRDRRHRGPSLLGRLFPRLGERLGSDEQPGCHHDRGKVHSTHWSLHSELRGRALE